MLENINDKIGQTVRVLCLKDIENVSLLFKDHPYEFSKGQEYSAEIRHSGYESRTVHISAKSNNQVNYILYGSSYNGTLDTKSKDWFDEYFKVVVS